MLYGSDRILLGEHGVIMFRRKSSAGSAFELKLLFTKFQLVCNVLYKNQTYNYLLTFLCSIDLEEMRFSLILSMFLNV